MLNLDELTAGDPKMRERVRKAEEAAGLNGKAHERTDEGAEPPPNESGPKRQAPPDPEDQPESKQEKAKGKTDGADPSGVGAIPLTPAAWMARELPPPDFLMGELFSTTSRVLIAADTGLGKSMLGLGVAFAMRLGRGFLHWTAHHTSRVLVLDGEMPRDLLKERIALACEWFEVEPPNDGLFILSREDVEDMPPLDTDEGREWLLGVIQALGGVDFVIFDNVSCLTVGDLREETTWKPLVPLARELSRCKVGQLWLHHVGHDKTKAYGSRTFLWQMDAVGLGTAVPRDGADVSMQLEWQKARRRTPGNREDFATVHVVLEKGTWAGTPVDQPTAPPRKVKPPPRLNDKGRIVAQAVEKAMKYEPKTPPSHPETAGVARAAINKTVRAYWRQLLGWEHLSQEERDNSRQDWKRGVENALAAGAVRQWGEWLWLLR